MENISRESTNSSPKPLTPKHSCTKINLTMEPTDATTSHLEEIYLQDKILRLLNSDHTGLDVTFLYKNESFLSDPMSLNYFDDDADASSFIQKIIAKRGNTNVSVVRAYYPLEQRAEHVNLPKKRNFFQKIRDWFRDHCCV